VLGDGTEFSMTDLVREVKAEVSAKEALELAASGEAAKLAAILFATWVTGAPR